MSRASLLLVSKYCPLTFIRILIQFKHRNSLSKIFVQSDFCPPELLSRPVHVHYKKLKKIIDSQNITSCQFVNVSPLPCPAYQYQCPGGHFNNQSSSLTLGISTSAWLGDTKLRILKDFIEICMNISFESLYLYYKVSFIRIINDTCAFLLVRKPSKYFAKVKIKA